MRAMEYTPRLYEIKNAWCRQQERFSGWTEAKRQFERLMFQIRASERAIGRRETSATKKLTDSECAAEYWRAEAEHTGMRNGEGVGWSSAEVMAALEREVSTWHRFATHPHADEEER